MTDKMQFDLVFTDCETTGLDPENDEIVELAVIRVDPRTYVKKGEFHRFFIPTVPVSAEVRAINGYDEAVWSERGAAPLCPADLDDLDEVLRDAAFAGQNVTFDRAFVRGGYASIGRAMPPMDYHLIDVASLAWPFVLTGHIPGMSLKYTRKLFGLPGEQTHAAMADVLDVLAVYRHLMNLYTESARCTFLKPIASMSAPKPEGPPSP